MRVYLDICCLNMPFDDQSKERIKLETDAVLSILDNCQTGEWILIGSEVIDLEISKTPDAERKKKVSILSSIASSKIIINEEIVKRAIVISKLKFHPYDALHIACAEKSNADVMLTTDDDLLQKALPSVNFLKIRIGNPVSWLMEVIK